MNRICLGIFLSLSIGWAAGCGGDDGPASDCAELGGRACFKLPAAAMTVTPEGGSATAPNLSCGPPLPIGAPSEVTVSGRVIDYRSQELRAGATVEYHDGSDFAGAVASATTNDAGEFSVTLPAGTPSIGHVKVAHADAVETRILQVELDVTQTSITGQEIPLASRDLVDVFANLLDRTRVPGTGIVGGAAVDCDGEGIANAIATLSLTSSAGDVIPTFVDGVPVYYTAEGSLPLPVRRSVRGVTTTNGGFLILDIPPRTEPYYVQIWGFPNSVDVARGLSGLVLVSEVPVTVAGESVTGIFMHPTEGP